MIAAGSKAPPAVRWLVAAGIAGVVAGAVFIMVTRGSAILLDLASGAARFFCL